MALESRMENKVYNVCLARVNILVLFVLLGIFIRGVNEITLVTLTVSSLSCSGQKSSL